MIQFRDLHLLARVPLSLVPSIAHFWNRGPLLLLHLGQLTLQVAELLLDFRSLSAIGLHVLLVLLLAVLSSSLVHAHIHGVVDLVRLLVILLVGCVGEETASVAFELNHINIRRSIRQMSNTHSPHRRGRR